MSELTPSQLTALAWPVAFVLITALIMIGYVIAEAIKKGKE